MRSFGPDPVDVDLPVRPRIRHLLDPPTPQFQREDRDLSGLGPALVVAGSDRRLDQVVQPAERQVLTDAPHILERIQKAGPCHLQRLVPIGLEFGIEFDPEDLEEQATDPWVSGQRVHHGPAARHGPDLERVARVGPQDGHLAPSQARGDGQLVQPVVGRQTRPHREQRLLQQNAALARRQRPLVGPLDDEAVDRRGARLRPGHFRGIRLDHAEPHVLQGRHHIGEDHRASLHEQPQEAGLHTALPIRLDRDLRQPAVLQRFQTFDVVDRRVDVHRRHVLRREGVQVRLRQSVRFRRPMSILQRPTQSLLPGPNDPRDVPLQPLDIQAFDPVRARRDVEMQPRRLALAQRQMVVQHRAADPLRQLVPETATDLVGVVPFRQDHHHVDPPTQHVGRQHQPDLTGVLGGHDRRDLPTQILQADEEQLLLGHAVEDRDDRLVIVRSLGNVLRLQNRLQLLPEDRRIARVVGVGFPGEEPQESMLADDLGRRVQLLDPDVVHPRTTMDTRLGIRLGDQQQGTEQGARLELGRKLIDRFRLPELRVPLVPQDPQTRAPLHRHGPAVVLEIEKVVAAIAEENEPIRLQPLEEVDDLRDLVLALGEPLPDLRQRVRHLVQLIDHRVEIVGRQPDLLHARPDLVLHRPDPSGVEVALELAVGDRDSLALGRPVTDVHDPALAVPLDHDHGMQLGADLVVSRGQVLSEGVHDEGSVADHDLGRGRVGVLLVLRHANRDLVRRCGLQKLERRADELHQLVFGSVPEEIARSPAEKWLREGLEELAALVGRPPLDRLEDPLEGSDRGPAVDFGIHPIGRVVQLRPSRRGPRGSGSASPSASRASQSGVTL